MDRSEDQEITMYESPSSFRATRKSFACWQRFVKKANASIGSTMTAATSMLGSLDGEFEENDDDSFCPWEDLEEDSFLNSSSSFKPSNLPVHIDDISVSSTGSMDLTQLQQHIERLHYMEPYESFHSSYDLGHVLGQGAFGSVHKCFAKESDITDSFAVKAVPMDKYNHDEIEILQDLEDCPNIVQVKDVFHHLEETYIVMEEIAGGELLQRIITKESYTEAEAKVLFKTLLETVKFCHEHGIAHCDIKPENILLIDPQDDTSIKLVDFGLAKRFRHHDGTVERIFKMEGSAEYAAPEVFNRSDDDAAGYDERCDIWSCGVVLYVMLGGYAPFEADTPEDVLRVVGEGKFKFHKHFWKHISKEAKVLIAKMIQVDPDKRCSLDEALASSWFEM
jgi:serine/threonine protein kinase